MPMIKLEDLNKVEATTITCFEAILNDFNDKIKLEEKKYPLTDREQIFVQTIRELLDALDTSHRRW